MTLRLLLDFAGAHPLFSLLLAAIAATAACAPFEALASVLSRRRGDAERLDLQCDTHIRLVAALARVEQVMHRAPGGLERDLLGRAAVDLRILVERTPYVAAGGTGR